MNDPSTEDRPAPPARTPFIHRHPWIILVVIFLVLIGAWTTMILIASKNRPEKVPLEHLERKELP
jgi:hypothetical protein